LQQVKIISINSIVLPQTLLDESYSFISCQYFIKEHWTCAFRSSTCPLHCGKPHVSEMGGFMM